MVDGDAAAARAGDRQGRAAGPEREPAALDGEAFAPDGGAAFGDVVVGPAEQVGGELVGVLGVGRAAGRR
ncbi:hypothetical protein [Kineosporia sp. A_224]|uniref:hypothetical protein n=1 Tax=Kineosporia sp. A_224 TaxID=1962180 RepID=UPI00117B16B9|nr:hypothetical protein [Kineosporia sp. A_224]